MTTLRNRLLGAGLAAAAASLAAPSSAQVLFWSTQASPIEETQAMREDVLAGFPGGVDYQASDQGPWLTRLQAELAGRLRHHRGARRPARRVRRARRTTSSTSPTSTPPPVLPSLMELGKLETEEQKYIPWMQATYVMAANKQALEYLPEGADLERAHLRPARRLGEGDGRGDRRAEVRLPGRPEGAEAPLLPGLPAARLHRLDGDRVPLRGRGRGLGRCSRTSGSTRARPRPATASCRSRS